MTLDPDVCHRALVAHDRRFDGVFFVGVTSTRIYCRPVCTVRAPKRANCRFYPSAAHAEGAGFRPCLRCRPETAPGGALVDAVDKLTRTAVARIEAGALDDGQSLEDLARGLGVTSRHLRRAMHTVLGVTPVALVQTRRLLHAKRLLTETDLPVIEIAFSSGFRSLRRFNALFLERYGFPPTRLRDRVRPQRGVRVPSDALALTLSYRPPLPWDTMLTYLAARRVPGVEWIDGGSYARTIRVRDRVGWFRVTPEPATVRVRVEVDPALTPVLPVVLARVRAIFDLDARPDLIDAHLAQDPTLRAAVEALPGLRVPGTADGFETAVRTIAGQQVSVAGATTLMARLVAVGAEKFETPLPELYRLPLNPRGLGALSLEKIRACGFTSARAAALLALAEAARKGAVPFEAGLDPEADAARWRAVPGIGDWTAAYLAMRVLRWPDTFLSGDLAVRRALGGLSIREAEARSASWRPWRSYAVLHLWHSSTPLIP